MHIEEIVIDERMIRTVSTVGELCVERYRLILMGIYKKDLEQFWFNPIASTLLEAGDIMLIVGEKSLIAEFSLSLRRSHR